MTMTTGAMSQHDGKGLWNVDAQKCPTKLNMLTVELRVV